MPQPDATGTFGGYQAAEDLNRLQESEDETYCLSWLTHALRRGEHKCHGVHVPGLDFARGNAHAGDVFELQQ